MRVLAMTCGCPLQQGSQFSIRLSDRIRQTPNVNDMMQGITLALVAQMVEHGTFNAGVLGSIPNERILDECYPRATAI